ncbi:MAG: hypothetical protein ACFCU7_09145 [Pleurocapsa sp.]
MPSITTKRQYDYCIDAHCQRYEWRSHQPQTILFNLVKNLLLLASDDRKLAPQREKMPAGQLLLAINVR